MSIIREAKDWRQRMVEKRCTLKNGVVLELRPLKGDTGYTILKNDRPIHIESDINMANVMFGGLCDVERKKANAVLIRPPLLTLNQNVLKDG